MDKEKRGEKNSLYDVVPVSVSCCCITNCHKILWLKTINILLFLMSPRSTCWLFWPPPAQLGQEDPGWSLTCLVIGRLIGLAGLSCASSSVPRDLLPFSGPAQIRSRDSGGRVPRSAGEGKTQSACLCFPLRLLISH